MSGRVAVSIQAAFLQFVVAATVGWLLLRGASISNASSLALAASIPALASVVLALFLNAFDALLPSAKIEFPAHLTLPLIHCALIALLASLVLTAPTAFESLPAPIRVATIWHNWIVLLICGFFEMASLSVLTLARSAK